MLYKYKIATTRLKESRHRHRHKQGLHCDSGLIELWVSSVARSIPKSDRERDGVGEWQAALSPPVMGYWERCELPKRGLVRSPGL